MSESNQLKRQSTNASAASAAALEGESEEQLEAWLTASTLFVVVVGASGDLAKKEDFSIVAEFVC